MRLPLTNSLHSPSTRPRTPGIYVDDDRALARLAMRGDRRAFDRLVERYLDRTLRICVRLVGNLEDAEDAVQETFTRAYSRLESFAGKSTFGTWVTSIALRLCADLERARKSRRRHVAGLPANFEIDRDARAPRSANPSLQSEQREQVRDVESALARLPNRLRTALTLRTIEGLDYAEVARLMGTTVRSSRLYVWEARQRLSRELGLDDDESDVATREEGLS